MQENKQVKNSKYLLIAGAIAHLAGFILLPLNEVFVLSAFGISYLFMTSGYYFNLKGKGYKPHKRADFYAMIFILLVPVLGPVNAIQKLYITPVSGEEVSKKKKWVASLVSIILVVLLAYMSYTALTEFRNRGKYISHITKVREHIKGAYDAKSDKQDNEIIEKELSAVVYELNESLKSNLNNYRKAQIYYYYGEVYKLRGDKELARKYYSDALKLDPERSDFINEKLNALQSEQNEDK